VAVPVTWRSSWFGLGDTAPPQARLSEAQREALIDIWTAIATKAGAASVEVVDTPLTEPPASGLPSVTVVPAGPAEPVAVPTAATGKLPDVTLTERSVAFLPNRDVYRDPDDVVRTLQPLSRVIISQNLKVTLTGTTADVGTPAGRKDLSLKRADAVRKTLVTLGVPASAITTRSVGSDWPGYVPDHDARGHLIPDKAARNRSVIVSMARP
jgi:outer membrane protein OmpA-like peptidoglycan-associated protein